MIFYVLDEEGEQAHNSIHREVVLKSGVEAYTPLDYTDDLTQKSGDWWIEFKADSLADAQRIVMGISNRTNNIPDIFVISPSTAVVRIPQEIFNPDKLPKQDYNERLLNMTKKLAKEIAIKEINQDIYNEKYFISNAYKRKSLNGNYPKLAYVRYRDFLSMDEEAIKTRLKSNRFLSREAIIPVVNPDLEKLFNIITGDSAAVGEEHVPNCLVGMLSHLKERRNFRHFAYIVSEFLKTAGLTVDNFLEYNQNLLKKHWHSMYAAEEERIAFLKEIFMQVGKKDNLNCDEMRRLVVQQVCTNCPYNKSIATIKVLDDLVVEKYAMLRKQFDRKGEPKPPKVITEFRIVPKYEIRIPDKQIIGDYESIYVTDLVDSYGNKLTKHFTADSFSGPTGFRRDIGASMPFHGGRWDISIMQSYIKNNIRDVRWTFPTRGIHEIKSKVYYVDCSAALCSDGSMTKAYNFKGAEGIQLKDNPMLEQRELSTIAELTPLLMFNEPNVVGRILGWFSACFLKARFFPIQFPLLYLGGESEAGKSMTAQTMLRLFSIDPNRPIPSLGGMTKATLFIQLSGSNLIPKVFNEYDPKYLSTKSSTLSYGEVTNLMKDLFDKGVTQRGEQTLKKLKEWELTAPACLLGEHFFGETGIVNRMIEVGMGKDYRTELMTKNFFKLVDYPLEQLGKSMLMISMNLTKKQVKQWYKENLMEVEYKSRKANNIAIVMTGLDLLAHTIIERTGNHEYAKMIKTMKRFTSGKEDQKLMALTDVDKLIQRLFDMFRRAEDYDIKKELHYMILVPDSFRYSSSTKALTPGHYILLNMRELLPLFRKDLRAMQDTGPQVNYVENEEILFKVIQKQKYFLKLIKWKTAHGTKIFYPFDMIRMIEKGIDPEPIITADDPSAKPWLEDLMRKHTNYVDITKTD